MNIELKNNDYVTIKSFSEQDNKEHWCIVKSDSFGRLSFEMIK